MTTIELKNILFHKIAAINDISFLNAIKTLVDTKSETIIYKTTAEQRAKIEIGIDQIKNGNYYTNEQVESEMNKWLKEK